MVKANIKANFPYNVERVWSTVTNFQNSSWRSDLSKTEILNARHFIEYTKGGYTTTFNIIVIKPYQRLEFEMENDNMTGYWIGTFSQINGETEIDFTEHVVAKKFYLKPFVKMYLKKQQNAYVKDLEKALQDSDKK
ncbi:polyketide cyclase [Tetragenococcus solitarius]|uniref:SRPBCC family protein n=1 Tax=Tetragenococcus solitarius TaxID=71453 RepID=A0ABN3YFH8_9ENTE|nr:polyketide cyclase [Tetragenococcus solitarius]